MTLADALATVARPWVVEGGDSDGLPWSGTRTSNAMIMSDWNKPCMRPDDIMSIEHVLKMQTKNKSHSDQAVQLSRYSVRPPSKV